jgi:hypothetical protein
MGLGLFSCTILVAGILIGVQIPILLLMLVASVIFVGPSWKALGEAFIHLIRNLYHRHWKISEIFLILLILGIPCLQLPAALTPTLFPDTLRYHFGLTHLFESIGRIVHLSDFAEGNLSSNWQMIYLPQLLLSCEITAQVFNWMVLPLTALAVALAAGTAAGIVAALALVSTPFLLEASSLGNNDLGVTFFAACMWLALLHEKLRARFLLAGVFAGFAIGTKYPAAIVALSVFISLLLIVQGSLQDRAKRAFLFALGVFVGYLPWFVRNSVWTGDPFYPILSAWLPWCEPDGAAVLQQYAQEMARYGVQTPWWDRIFLGAWRVTVADPKFFESDVGILFWAALPFVLWWSISKSRDPILSLITFVTLFAGIIWIMGSQVTRFLGPCIPGGAIATALVWERLRQQWNSFSKLGIPVLLLLLLLNIWQGITSIAGFSNPYEFLLQGMTREQYLGRYSEAYRIAKWVGQGDRVHSTVLLVGEQSVFLFQNPIRISGPFDAKWIVEQVKTAPSAKELKTALVQSGIHYLCVNEKNIQGLDHRFGYMRWTPEVQKAFFDFLKQETELVQRTGDTHLYWITEP